MSRDIVRDLKSFLASPVTENDDVARVETERKVLIDLFDRILHEKFENGDVQVITSNSRTHTLHYANIPNAPARNDEIANARHTAILSEMQSLLCEYAANVGRRLSIRLREREILLSKKAELTGMVVQFSVELDNDIAAAEQTLGEIRKFGEDILDPVTEADLLQQFAFRMESTVEDLRQSLNQGLDHLEQRLTDERTIFRVLDDARQRFGRRAFAAEFNRFNQIGERNRLERRGRRLRGE